MTRPEMLARLARHQGPWDIVIIGGGATGAGIAVDAATRGYSVALLEQSDFGKGTSSRSTKLVHGGVRYLQQGNISLVREALKERAILRRNAPHLVKNLPLVIPAYAPWERAFYGAGLTAYDLLAGRSGFGRSSLLSTRSTLERLPTLNPDGLRGGVLYFDGQFDDARLLINLVRTAADGGAVLLNYARVHSVLTTGGRVEGIVATDEESGDELRLHARVVINATGAFVDGIRQLTTSIADLMIAPSQGTHIVLDRRFVPGESALMVPRVGDGRVMFAIPWRGHTLVGTTDTPIPAPTLEPRPMKDEVDFLLRTAARYLKIAPTRNDVCSVFAGVRPLVSRGESRVTAALSRDHTIDVDPSGLVTTTGGKWTTYRHMAMQTIDRAAAVAGLPARACRTADLHIHGFDTGSQRYGELALYGADAQSITELSRTALNLAAPLDDESPVIGAEVAWAVRYEMARTVEDVLARRCRTLFLNAQAARRMAPAVAAILARELQQTDEWQRAQVCAFEELARNYTLQGSDDRAKDPQPEVRRASR
ncbi:MAG: glycerol-3-phosphate dehydrogenase/oxidase [Acidobacteria bacterium]|nr:glycerol-3-phosphate dehydrogenase/oxidase [Acidobacteriota bacterium]